MKIINVGNYQELSERAAKIVIETVQNKPNAVLGLATGSTPIGLYNELIDDHAKNGTSYRKICTFNLDEYVGLEGSHPQSYLYFMRQHLFNHIDISSENTFIPNGKAEDMMKECERYEELIKEKGGIDLQILGIGQNGHIGFNEPGTSFSSRTHIIQLTESTRKANSRFFSSMDEVPTHAVTVGIQTIMESRKILLLVSGQAKMEAFKRLLSDEIDESFPASVLKLHNDVTVITDIAFDN
ncbi:Glucosamine-6-phosphate deaminase [Caldibacillus thermoamylovorans]|uniref:Glucosamine-6-phosphate deaminase n=1 Tax=Caldibacillus thermoamylovorans TaxID=35841 RepID=A0A090KW01_9BACI|nr:glucosamine-6-phosphate deaminase [Caldibacillus thermoamylovorans]CEE02859.1 Glucosamine-6-phosphate deaminase [Caldibacillus thermoamylovorans]